eukprot:3428422-Karenia_brevis.AAC.1
MEPIRIKTLKISRPQMLENWAKNTRPGLLQNLWHAARVGVPGSIFIEIFNDKTSGYHKASNMCIRVLANLFVSAFRMCCKDLEDWNR